MHALVAITKYAVVARSLRRRMKPTMAVHADHPGNPVVKL
jgi:hypothetical protein